MSAIVDRLKRVKDRVLPPSSADKRHAKLERRRKKAAAEALRRELQGEDMSSKVHRK